jgi:hypothetical protein
VVKVNESRFKRLNYHEWSPSVAILSISQA